MNARNLPVVDPMMVRRIVPVGLTKFYGGVLVMEEFEAEEVGLADARLGYDEPVVDCSRRIFQLTTDLMMADRSWALTCFPSRRWRNHREGMDIISYPDADTPLLYLGNPVRVFADPGEGILVVRIPEFLIKTGPELGY